MPQQNPFHLQPLWVRGLLRGDEISKLQRINVTNVVTEAVFEKKKKKPCQQSFLGAQRSSTTGTSCGGHLDDDRDHSMSIPHFSETCSLRTSTTCQEVSEAACFPNAGNKCASKASVSLLRKEMSYLNGR